jgi:hypothetical protein
MGFVLGELSPTEQSMVRELQLEILRVLRNASDLVKKGECKATCKRWFGDDTDTWTKDLGRKLNQLASILNAKDISLHPAAFSTQSARNERSTSENAAAFAPRGGWGEYTGMTRAQGQGFEIRLNSAWNVLPKYSPRGTSVQSKFETLVHELTHIILNTDDVPPPYGDTNCLEKARTTPDRAKQNAENWGFFVEDMRVPTLNPVVPAVAAVSYTEWMEKTKRNALHYRSNELSKLDKALKATSDQDTSAHRSALKLAFYAWFNLHHQEHAKRNVDGVVDRLKSWVDSF